MDPYGRRRTREVGNGGVELQHGEHEDVGGAGVERLRQAAHLVREQLGHHGPGDGHPAQAAERDVHQDAAHHPQRRHLRRPCDQQGKGSKVQSPPNEITIDLQDFFDKYFVLQRTILKRSIHFATFRHTFP